MPGPLPNPDRVRRNAPTIPTTNLPASGRAEKAPSVPKWIELGAAGKGWWKWAWSTPQAAAWSDGDLVFLAHRAQLEDDLEAVDRNDVLNVFLDDLDEDSVQAKFIRKLAALATGRLQIVREMREIDGKLGLTPKGMADLRWKIVPDVDQGAQLSVVDESHKVTKLDDRRRRLTGTDA